AVAWGEEVHLDVALGVLILARSVSLKNGSASVGDHRWQACAVVRRQRKRCEPERCISRGNGSAVEEIVVPDDIEANQDAQDAVDGDIAAGDAPGPRPNIPL